MPVITDRLKGGIEFGRHEIAFPRRPEKDQQRDQTKEHVQSVEASQSKECCRKHIGTKIDSGLKQFPILVYLTAEEDTAEEYRQREPAKHGTATLLRESNLRSPKCETAREKTNAEHQRSRHIKPFRSRTCLGPSVEIQIGKDKRREESCFGKNKAHDSDLVMIGKSYRGAILAYNRVRPIGISQIP